MRISRDCLANFVADFRTTFVRVSRECRENCPVSRTSREVFQQVEKFYANFFSKIFRKTVARLSCDGRATFVRVSPRNFGEFTMRNFLDTRTNVARQSCETLATIRRENKTKRHSFECRATLARMSRDCRTNLNENKLHSR